MRKTVPPVTNLNKQRQLHSTASQSHRPNSSFVTSIFESVSLNNDHFKCEYFASFCSISARHAFVSGNVNGVNVIGLALQGPSVPGLQLVNIGGGRSPSTLDMGYTYQHPLQARGPTREYATNKGKPNSM